VAAAEATWADLFPALSQVALLGVPHLVAEVCYGLWWLPSLGDVAVAS
jgi:hypothetical protein